MSFSSKVKGELSLHFGNGRHCEIAEIAAYVNIYGQIAVFGGNFCLKIQTENDYAVKKCFTLLRNTFNMIADVSVRISGQKRQTKVYTLLVRDAAAILQATGILTIEKEQKKLKKRIYPPVVSSICCRRAYIRGAFISVGSVNDPEKNYHLEFVLADLSAAEQLREYDSLSNRFQSGGGYEMDVDVDKVCNGLGIPAEQRAQEFDSLSGGEKTRANLARLLLEKTDILLLDEPTNHLDVDAKDSLKKALQEYRGSILLICHEPEFYQDVVNEVWDMSKWTTKVF
mgnify:CR=1 FL=1